MEGKDQLIVSNACTVLDCQIIVCVLPVLLGGVLLFCHNSQVK